MKKVTIGMLIASGICIISGTALTAAGVASGGKAGLQITENGIRTADDIKEAVRTTEDLNNAKRLILNVEGLYLNVTESDSFAVSWKCPEDEFEVEKREKGDTVEITVKQKKQPEAYISMFDMGASVQECEIQVTIPENKTLDSLEIAGDYEMIDLEDFSVKTLKAVSESGTINCENVQALAAELQSDNGQIYCKGMQGKTLMTITESAEVDLNKITYNEWKAKSEQGEIRGDKIMAQKADVQTEDSSVNLSGLDGSTIKVVSDNGDIYLDMNESLEGYHLKLYSKYGSTYVDEEEVMPEEDRYPDDEEVSVEALEEKADSNKQARNVYEQNKDAGKSVEVSCREGQIDITGK